MKLPGGLICGLVFKTNLTLTRGKLPGLPGGKGFLMLHLKKCFEITLLLLSMLCFCGCYTETKEPTSYSSESFKMTEEVKMPDMTVKRPAKKKSITNLWGLF